MIFGIYAIMMFLMFVWAVAILHNDKGGPQEYIAIGFVAFMASVFWPFVFLYEVGRFFSKYVQKR